MNQELPNLPFEDYCSLDAVNFSSLKHILRSPKAYQEALRGREDPDEDLAEKFAIGQILHSLVLEGKDISDCFAIKPEGLSMTTKEGKAWKAAQTLPIVSEKEMNGVPKMAQAIADDPDARAILQKCTQRELSLSAVLHGIPFKARLDGVFADLDGVPFILDLKSCLDAREEAFAKSIANYSYDLQLEVYSRVYEAVYGVRPGYLWIAVEKRGGFDVQIWMPDDSIRQSGHRKMERAMELLLTCRKLGEWPGYERGIKTIAMPKWAKDI